MEYLEQHRSAASHLPLSALLSQVLVAFTIEFDNEFEHQMPHQTSKHGPTPGSRYAPWLVSLAMWSNCMQYVGDKGITVAELRRLARTGTNLAGMQRWGYIIVEPTSADSRSQQLRPDALIRATTAGRQAQEVCRPLFGIIEERWQERFGQHEIDQLRQVLYTLISQFDIELPDCLPILRYGLFSGERRPRSDRSLSMRADHQWHSPARRGSDGTSHLPLSALLSRVLLAFAIEFERESDVSLAISANVLRILDQHEVQVRDLPLLTGVSKEAISMAMGILQQQRLAVIEPDPTGSRFKVVRLTPKGRQARDASGHLLSIIEQRWQERFGQDDIRNLRESLERLVGDSTAQRSPLFKGLEPYPDGWRASVRKPDTLPHYPMVLHRGGFPDGS